MSREFIPAGANARDVTPHIRRGTIYVVPDSENIRLPSGFKDEFGEAPNFRDYWHIIDKHKRKILACVAAAVIVTTAVVFSMTPIYTARTTLLIDRQAPQIVKIQQVLSESVDADEYSFYQSQYELLKSRSVAADVIKTRALVKNRQFTSQSGVANIIAALGSSATGWFRGTTSAPPSVANRDPNEINPQLIDAYQGNLEIEPLKRSRLVRIAFSAADPVLAADIANEHARAYIRQGQRLRAQANEEAKNFLESKMGELKDRVQKSEDSLNRFRRERGIISLDDKENIVVDRLADLNKRLTEAEADRIGLEAQASLIKKRDYDSLPAVIANPLIQNLKSLVVQLEAEHAKLSAQFLPGYPRLAQVKAQLEEAKARLAQQIKGVVEGINSSYLGAAGKERELRGQMNKQKSDALALKDAAVEYAILEREADTNKQLYDGVLERFKEINIAAEMPASNVSILDRAGAPLSPTKPQKRLSVMLGALLGLLAGLGLAFVIEHLDNTLRTPDEVERYLGLANLVMVPDFFTVPKGEQRWKLPFIGRPPALEAKLCAPNKSLVPSANLRRSVVTEVYRKLRTAILLSRSEEPPRSILFTSSTAGEGKTITVANTAIMLAQKGHRVLVIDADLRRPSCHRALKVHNGRGLTEFLAGHEPLQSVIKESSMTNLFVLNSGSVPPNPGELIGSKKMQESLVALRNQYDFILIDTPPIAPLSDAVVLSPMVDGVIFVVRGQHTPKQLVKAAIAELRYDPSKILGVVLNRVDIRSGEYANYYRDYASDYYSSVGLA